jgi:hypothetical protein
MAGPRGFGAIPGRFLSVGPRTPIPSRPRFAENVRDRDLWLCTRESIRHDCGRVLRCPAHNPGA